MLVGGKTTAAQHSSRQPFQSVEDHFIPLVGRELAEDRHPFEDWGLRPYSESGLIVTLQFVYSEVSSASTNHTEIEPSLRFWACTREARADPDRADLVSGDTPLRIAAARGHEASGKGGALPSQEQRAPF